MEEEEGQAGVTPKLVHHSMSERVGWTRVCPDGKLRGYPYGNKGDAEFDADWYTKKGKPCTDHGGDVHDPPEWTNPPCPGGEHTVEPVAFNDPVKEESHD